jgi:hypothetical protein
MRSLRPLLRALVLPALFAATASHLPANAQEGNQLTLQDLLAVEPIGESSLSPGGKTIAFAHSGQIFLPPAEGGWPVPLTSTQGGKSGLDWSPRYGTTNTSTEEVVFPTSDKEANVH